MISRLVKVACLLLGCLFYLTEPGLSHVKKEAPVNQIEVAVSDVLAAPSKHARRAAAERLASLAKGADAKDISKKTVGELIALLDYPDDTTRYWVATAIGNVGPPAKSAITVLERMLPNATCLNGAITSASGIRYALVRLGVKEIREKKCIRIVA